MKDNTEKLTQFLLRKSKHQKIRLDELLENPIQPPLRDTDSAVKALKNNIEESRVMAPVVVSFWNGKFYIADGHRRVAAARLLGLQDIECIVVEDVAPEVLFCLLNAGIRNVKGKDWFYVWAKTRAKGRSVILDSCPSACVRHILNMADICGEKDAITFGLSNADIVTV